MKEIIVRQTSIVLPDYDLGDCIKLENSLSVFNREDRYTKVTHIGYDYNSEERILYVPRGLDINFIAKITGRKIVKDTNFNKPEKASIRLTSGPRNDLQKESVAFLVGERKFLYTQNFSQKVLTLPTGAGKTYVTIAAMSFIKEKVMIITHVNLISEQWEDKIQKFTQICEDDICILAGTKQLEKFEERYKEKGPLPYKIYIVNHDTLRAYAKKYGWENLNNIFKVLGIGIKVYDEAHKHFENIINVDLHTNVKRTFYLTATFRRSDRNEQKVFDLCFKNVVKFGESSEGKEHINYFIYKYNSRPSKISQADMKGHKGFKIYNYCDYCMKQDLFKNALKTLLDLFTKTPGSIVILISKIDACEKIKDFVQNLYPDEIVDTYHSKKSKEENDVALEASIIIATIGGFGTGSDIPGLRFCINAVPYSSTVTADQISGRLRKIDDTTKSVYCEIIDTGFKSINRMLTAHKSYLSERCGETFIMDESKLQD